MASDSDKFKIIITLRRAQKFGDTGPYKNFEFLVQHTEPTDGGGGVNLPQAYFLLRSNS